jgi:hypothetical protein
VYPLQDSVTSVNPTTDFNVSTILRTENNNMKSNYFSLFLAFQYYLPACLFVFVQEFPSVLQTLLLAQISFSHLSMCVFATLYFIAAFVNIYLKDLVSLSAISLSLCLFVSIYLYFSLSDLLCLYLPLYLYLSDLFCLCFSLSLSLWTDLVFSLHFSL